MSKHLVLFCRRASSGQHHSLRRSAFTLVEVLVATAVTLLMMVALARIFSDIGKSMKQGRAALQLNSQLRDVAFRIRRDLNNLTANPNELPGMSTGRGYFEYYDGPQTDYSTQLLGSSAANRIGDVDDILMFTARAGDVWFTGKVPGFILSGVAPSSADGDGNGLIDSLENPISVASQHAEIAIWCEPVVAATSLATTFTDSNGNPYNNVQRDPSYLIANPAFFDDKDGDLVPDSYRLHYRTMIIRPDLNLATGVLPNNGSVFTAGPNTVAAGAGGTLPQTPPATFSLPVPACDMFRVHGACDLSLRRVYDGSPTTRDAVAANSLEDLENPANRFAHFQPLIPGTSSTTGPVLALGPSIPALGSISSLPLVFDFGSANAPPTGPGIAGSGFLHPAYTLFGVRAGEDVLANNILAFDVKGFDPAVPLRASSGIDSAPGAAGFDDDGDGTTDNASEFGWAGSDDMVLSPNDPGYGNALTNTIVGFGDYVDLDWGRKLIRHGASISSASNVWSPLSGLTQSGTTFQVATSLRSSSKVITTAAGSPILVDQPTYDTWTPLFEADGLVQGNLTSATGGLLLQAGTSIRVNGGLDLYSSSLGSDMARVFPPYRNNYPDSAGDGLDNNGVLGADDISERETSAPYPTPLRGVKISIRMEDPGARQVRELPVAVEFVTR